MEQAVRYIKPLSMHIQVTGRGEDFSAFNAAISIACASYLSIVDCFDKYTHRITQQRNLVYKRSHLSVMSLKAASYSARVFELVMQADEELMDWGL